MINYSFDKNFTVQQVQSLFQSVNWESGNYPERLYRALINSETVLSVCADDAELVGLMTAVSDGGMNVYFPYLLVHPRMQHREIGRTLVKMMLCRYRKYYRKILVCPDYRVRFYQSTGWKKAHEQTAMMICSFPE